MPGFVSEFEWQASNAYRFYPFAGRPSTGAVDLHGVIVDAAVACPSSRVRLGKLRYDDGWSALLFGEEPDWSSEVPLAENAYGPWTILTGDGLRLILRDQPHPSVLDGAPILDAWFVPHVLEAEPARLASLKVEGQRLSGQISFTAGYNVALTAGTPTRAVRTSVPITMEVSAGSGEGLVPCAEQTKCRTPVQRINKTAPGANGNFRLEGVDCYDVLPDLATDAALGEGLVMTEALLRILNSCSPCCDCSDYGIVYGEVLGALLDRARELAARHAEVRRKYAEFTNEYERVAACRSVPEVLLNATGMYNRTANIAIGLKNNSGAPWPAVPAWVEVAITPAEGAHLVAGSVRLHGDGYDAVLRHEYENGLFRFLLDPVPCCSVTWVTFDLVWDGVGGFVQVQAKATGDLDGVQYDLTARTTTKMPVNRKREAN